MATGICPKCGKNVEARNLSPEELKSKNRSLEAFNRPKGPRAGDCVRCHACRALFILNDNMELVIPTKKEKGFRVFRIFKEAIDDLEGPGSSDGLS